MVDQDPPHRLASNPQKTGHSSANAQQIWVPILSPQPWPHRRVDNHPSGYGTVASYALPRVGSPSIDLLTFTDLSNQIFAAEFDIEIPTYYGF